MFRALSDGSKIFSNKTNLSNTPNGDSINAEIAAAGNCILAGGRETQQVMNQYLELVMILAKHLEKR
jgi:hypothetical protein